ncbi:MAG: hypothetical protein LQ344_000991 [Seirophora lacunosa]|nr:MAG: hypothetical protein LQ344_000991 [Seirophora lacunosa]
MMRPPTLTQLLKRALSLHPLLPLSNSLSPPHHLQPFKIIGLGTCGTVFSIPSSPLLALQKGGQDLSAVRADFVLTNRTHSTIALVLPSLLAAFPDGAVMARSLPHRQAAASTGRAMEPAAGSTDRAVLRRRRQAGSLCGQAQRELPRQGVPRGEE